MNLYELSTQYQGIAQRIDAEDGVLDDALEAELDAVTDDLEAKVEAVCRVRAGFLAEAAAIKVEEERLRKRRQAAEGNAERLKRYLYSSLRLAGVRKVKGLTHTVSIAKGVPVVVLDMPIEDLPDEAVRIKKEVDTAAIGARLKAGEKLEYAHLEEGKESLRVR